MTGRAVNAHDAVSRHFAGISGLSGATLQATRPPETDTWLSIGDVARKSGMTQLPLPHCTPLLASIWEPKMSAVLWGLPFRRSVGRKLATVRLCLDLPDLPPP